MKTAEERVQEIGVYDHDGYALCSGYCVVETGSLCGHHRPIAEAIQQAMDEAGIEALEWARSNHEKECYLCQSAIKMMGKNSDIIPCLEWHEKGCYLCHSTIKMMNKNPDITPCLEWKELRAEIERRKEEVRHA